MDGLVFPQEQESGTLAWLDVDMGETYWLKHQQTRSLFLDTRIDRSLGS